MHDLLALPSPPATEGSMSQLESTIGIEIPSQLRALLERANGGPLRADQVLRVPDGSTSGALRVLRAEEIEETTLRSLGQIPDKVAFARDGNGNLLTIDTRSRVYFWDHDSDEHIPFDCDLEHLAEHFFSRPVSRSKSIHPGLDPLEDLFRAEADEAEVMKLVSHTLSETPELTGEVLHMAARYNRGAAVRHIIRDHRPSRIEQHKALCRASARGSLDAIRELVGAGADVDGRDEGTDMTRLMEAALGAERETVELLLQLGANPTLETRRGQSAADMAGLSGDLELEALLESAGERHT